MAAIKETSVIQENKNNAFVACPVTFVMEKIGGYWKPIILFSLLSGPKRYSELKRSIPAVTEKVLIQHLKQLENDGLIIREPRPVVPPYVTYKLSKSGRALRPVLYAMAEWAVGHGGEQSGQFSKQIEDFPAEWLDYPHYIQKAEKKERTKDAVLEIIFWLTGYDKQTLQQLLDNKTDFETFFAQAPQINPNVSKITGLICGYRVEEIEEELMQKIRYLDKLIDELAKGKAMDKILRK